MIHSLCGFKYEELRTTNVEALQALFIIIRILRKAGSKLLQVNLGSLIYNKIVQIHQQQ